MTYDSTFRAFTAGDSVPCPDKGDTWHLEDDEAPTWPGHELVESVNYLHERVLRNLCLAAEAESERVRFWHFMEADEMHNHYINAHNALRSWLVERGVHLPAREPRIFKKQSLTPGIE